LYDPATGTWLATGSLGNARAGHSATLLPSGKVLVAGGLEFRWNGALEAAPVLSLELYDPITGTWTPPEPLENVHAHSATLLPSGDVLVAGGADRSNAALYDPDGRAEPWRPQITSGPETLSYGKSTTLTVGRFRGDSEASGVRNSVVDYPLIQMSSIEGAQLARLVPDPLENFWDDPIPVTISDLPPTLNPGWHHLTVVTGGIRSESKLVRVECGIAITAHPEDTTAATGSTATLAVKAQGGRSFQWQKDGVDIPGATTSGYTTPPITAADSGTTYRVKVDSGCASATSRAATLTAEDGEPPVATVVSPSGGEYWRLPASGSPASPSSGGTQHVVWSMSDNVRICRVDVSLWYSDDGGMHYSRVPDGGGLPAAFGRRGTCPHPGEGTKSVAYVVPATPPSGLSGSLYKVRVRVRDHAGQVTTAWSRNPFYIVQPNPDTVKTLILANTARMRSQMEITPARAAKLQQKLQELANHPQVLGRVIDLNGVTTISNLYAAWDADPSDPAGANAVLFGAGGIHEHLLELLDHTFTGVEYGVLVGDDRIIPLARIQDRTILLLEENYPAGGDLTPDGTTVGQALAANKYLSDDPLAVLDPVRPDELSGNLYIPDL
ncbi:MAG: hypothetical protein GY856_15070, partial [bacterium]|nr:hypothetical protein [bacterium]